jgi:outer membrane receptor for ferrienterochelin and colicin
MDRKKIVLWILILHVFLTTILFARGTGKIVGTVVDEDTKEPLVGANVYIPGTTLGSATDADGYFVILNVPPGKYTLQVDYIGYESKQYQNVQVLTDLTTTLEIELKPQAIAGEVITVVAETPTIRKDLTSTEARVQAEQIDKIPVRELNDLLNLQAGVTRDAVGGIHIRGGRSSEVLYTVNGITITDDFSRSQSIQVENQSIQELQVISGTFNAEYGNAMSGIINIVTKIGSDHFSMNFDVWNGDYFSNRTDIFWNIDEHKFADIYNFQTSLQGPIYKDKIRYFGAVRRWRNDGWLYGPKAYLPQGRVKIATANGDSTYLRGDSSAVAMNYRDRWSGQFSVQADILSNISLKMDVFASYEERKNYNHGFRLNPLGTKPDKEFGFAGFFSFTHTLSSKTFYQFTYANKFNEFISRLYDDPHDPRYVSPDSLYAPAYKFLTAGTDLSRFYRYTKTQVFKFDLTSQVSKRHQMKTGFEYQTDELYYEDITLVPKQNENGEIISPFVPYIRPITDPTTNIFTRRPRRFAAYIQDKIEYETIIINVGVRFDLFDPNGKLPADPEDPNVYNPFKLIHIYKDLNGDGTIGLDEQRDDNKYTLEERKAFWYKNTSVKTQVSPRLGIAYPISEKGVLHFSYGIFQQIPQYSLLYVGDELKITTSSGTQGVFGNPDLKPERTTMYEFGIKHELFNDYSIDVTGFYKDIRDWISVGAPIPTAISGVSYVTRINRDYANIKGITLSFTKKYTNNFGFNIDYTFQVAEGTNSSPDQEFFKQLSGAEPTNFLTPLDWDQRHTLNSNFYYETNNWGFSFITRYSSGQPYTPQIVISTGTGQNVFSGLQANSRRKPNLFFVDFNMHRNFKVFGKDLQLYLQVYNLLDGDNATGIYADTGKPDFTLVQLIAKDVDADPTYFVHPEFYSEPRKVIIGAKFSL